MTAPDQIISDEEVIRVHGHANFGPMTPREVLADGILKYAYGYTSGHTQLTILLEHGLIRKPKPGSYYSTLTKKGQEYLRAAWPIANTRAPATLAVPEVAALVAAAEKATAALVGPCDDYEGCEEALADLRAALAALREGGQG